MNKRPRPSIGAHISVAGGLHKAIENAREIGAECAQIFGSNPRQWGVTTPKEEEVKRFKIAYEESELSALYLHASYLPNIASPENEMVKKSIQNLADHLTIAESIGANGLIFHPGSGKGRDRKDALDQEVLAIKNILKRVKGSTELIVENTAGGGDKIGSVEDIAYIVGKVNSPRVKVCIDTAHALEAGEIKKYDEQSLKKFCKVWNDAVGLKNIPVLHINDSKTEYNSHNDKHENIGKGHIGISGFRVLAKEARLRAESWILEVPGFNDRGPDQKNIDLVRACF